MAKPRKPAPDLRAYESLAEPPELPTAEGLVAAGLPFKSDELARVKIGVAFWRHALTPSLDWQRWLWIGHCLQIGRKVAERAAGRDRFSAKHHLTIFLRRTGLAFMNKGLRHALDKVIKRLDEVEAWRDTLSEHRQRALNNPLAVWTAFVEEVGAEGLDPNNPDHAAMLERRGRTRKTSKATMLDYLHELEAPVAAQAAELAALRNALTKAGAPQPGRSQPMFEE